MLKERKTHNKYSKKFKQPNHILQYGCFGIKVTSFGRLTEAQCSSLKWLVSKKLKLLVDNKKNFRFWMPLFLNSTLTKFSLESRMGKGKGSIYTHAIYIRPGIILFEFDNITEQQMKKLFFYLVKKISFKIVLIQ
uniref:Ribosomal protein L16 n=1 Tax=Hydropuntia rangiferina TaxID=338881 RepID=A0A345UBA8_9FLOR|nr:ribosomal protein L16 [Hydropuntia rangiferina]AXI97744.1 ribosomal protein L16 [Hydropuntia rangiferina]UAD89770.1 ribosomal protein L16 [Hydropuntia rangiferina]